MFCKIFIPGSVRAVASGGFLQGIRRLLSLSARSKSAFGPNAESASDEFVHNASAAVSRSMTATVEVVSARAMGTTPSRGDVAAGHVFV